MVGRFFSLFFILVPLSATAAPRQCISLFAEQRGSLFATGLLNPGSTMPSAHSFQLQTPHGPLVYHVFDHSPPTDGLLAPQVYLNKLHNSFEKISPRQIGINRPEAIENDPGVNCHGYAAALSRIPGIPERTWIQSLPTERNLGHSPLNVLLKTYFDPIASYSNADYNLDAVSTNSNLKPGDWVVFSRTTIKDGPVAIHSALVIANPAGENRVWVRSKLGSGITVENEISVMTFGGYQPAVGYDSRSSVWLIDRIDVYRRK